MNRLRGAYLEMEPELAPYFVTGSTEDAAGHLQDLRPHRKRTALGPHGS